MSQYISQKFHLRNSRSWKTKIQKIYIVFHYMTIFLIQRLWSYLGHFFLNVIYKWWKQKNMKFNLLYFRKSYFLKQEFYKSIKIRFLSCWRLKILKELSVVNVCNEFVFYKLAFLWTVATLRSPRVNHLRCLCIVCDVQNSRIQTFNREYSNLWK